MLFLEVSFFLFLGLEEKLLSRRGDWMSKGGRLGIREKLHGAGDGVGGLSWKQ